MQYYTPIESAEETAERIAGFGLFNSFVVYIYDEQWQREEGNRPKRGKTTFVPQLTSSWKPVIQPDAQSCAASARAGKRSPFASEGQRQT